MKGYTFRITAEDQEGVFRDILLPENLNFEDFHFALLDAFEINPGEMASFYLSNDRWEKEKEITLMDMGMSEEGKGTALMSDTFLFSIQPEIGIKLLFVYDFLFCKNFKVELVAIEEKKQISPLLIQSKGTYKSDTSGFADLLLEDFEEEEQKPSKKETKKPLDIMDGFDEFDNFQSGIDDHDDPQFENIDDIDI